MSSTNVSTLVPVAARALEIDSVDGQRARPSGVMRLERLNVVGSRPERLASPEAERPERAARRSRAVQICECVSMTTRMVLEFAEGRSETIILARPEPFGNVHLRPRAAVSACSESARACADFGHGS